MSTPRWPMAQIDAAGMAPRNRAALARVFHALLARSADRAYHTGAVAVVGRVPSRGVLSPFQAQHEIPGSGSHAKTPNPTMTSLCLPGYPTKGGGNMAQR